MMYVPELSYDLYHWIIQAVANSSTDGTRDKTCLKTLLACCLVNSTWHRLAQPIINQTVLIETQDDLDRRIFSRSKEDLSGLRNIVIREKGGPYSTFDVERILRALPKLQLLRFFACYDGGRLPGCSEDRDRELVGTSHFSPKPLDLDLSGLREAVLGSIPAGPNWVPLMLASPNLRCLVFHCCGWCVSSFIDFRFRPLDLNLHTSNPAIHLH
jgi:hypothetical protein